MATAAKNDWKTALTFSPSCIEHKVAGKTLRFYPLSLRMVFRLKSVAKPVIRALTVLFTPNKQDTAATSKDYTNLAGGGAGPDGRPNPSEVVSEASRTAISPELAKLRHEQRQAALDEVIETLMDETNRDLLVEIIMDSLRDNCPRKPEPGDIEEFGDGLTLDLLRDYIIGIGKANMEVFGPLGRQALATVRAKAAAEVALPGDPEPDSPSTATGITG